MNLYISSDLEDKGSILNCRDVVMREIKAVQGLIELKAVSNGGHSGVEDGEARDVGVQRDREVDEAGVCALDTQLNIITLAS